MSCHCVCSCSVCVLFTSRPQPYHYIQYRTSYVHMYILYMEFDVQCCVQYNIYMKSHRHHVPFCLVLQVIFSLLVNNSFLDYFFFPQILFAEYIKRKMECMSVRCPVSTGEEKCLAFRICAMCMQMHLHMSSGINRHRPAPDRFIYYVCVRVVADQMANNEQNKKTSTNALCLVAR